jgi:superfamily II DNA or RNA helicase
MTGTGAALQQSQATVKTAPSGAGGGGGRRWPRGCLVRVRGRRWRVEESRSFADCQMLSLSGTGRADWHRHLVLLSPFDRPQPVEMSSHLCRVSWRQWLRAFCDLAAGAAPYGRLRTASSARIHLHAYQVEPSLVLLNGMATRVLLADEVGLGKTIQAGLFVSELHARLSAPRSLILTPAGLRDQWRCELHDRFGIDATVVDAPTLRQTLARIAAGKNPWAIWPVIVASFDFVKQPDVLRALDPFTWDALVVDEAHQCAIAPERSAAVRLLASRSRHVLLLTATPHAGDDDAFERLCRFGQVDRADAIVMFRRSRSDVGIERTRRVHLLRVRCSDGERRVHRLLDRYTKAVWNAPSASSDARLAMVVLRKRALSSAFALTQSLVRRREALFDVPSPVAQMALPFAGDAEPDEETPEDEEPVGCLAAPGMDDARERAWLDRLLEAARDAARCESKLRRLARLLRGVRQPAIVFTEYRDTARWLAGALQALGDVVLLHGGLSRAERQDVERRFRGGQAQFLVATDAAGQGLNLHHRCRLVVNLELPWNPIRLEQRIGRVDRLGQTRRPHAIHLVARDTAEEHIVRHLIVRQQRARQRVGEVSDAVGAAMEEVVAAAVMTSQGGDRHPSEDGRFPDQSCACDGGVRASHDLLPRRTPGLQPGGEPVFRTIDLHALALEEVARLSLARRLWAAPDTHPARRSAHDRTRAEAGLLCRSSRIRTSGGRARAPAEGCVATMPGHRARRSGLRRGLLCVFVVRGTDTTDEVLDESLVSLHLDVAPTFALRTAAPRDVGNWPGLRERAVAEALSGARAAATEAFRRTTAACLERERAMEAAECRPVPVQPGMFDRRALVQAEREDAGRAARDAGRTEHLSVLAARMAGPLAWHAELALVLVIPDK